MHEHSYEPFVLLSVKVEVMPCRDCEDVCRLPLWRRLRAPLQPNWPPALIMWYEAAFRAVLPDAGAAAWRAQAAMTETLYI
jgi:hypothetical protein